MTVTEMVGFYQLQCEPVREMLRRYLTERAWGASARQGIFSYRLSAAEAIYDHRATP